MNKKVNHISFHTKHTFRLCLLFTAVLLCILLGGCTDNSIGNGENPDAEAAPSPSQPPDDTADSTVHNNNPSSDIDEEPPALLTIEQAKMLILSNIDITKFELETINTSLIVDNDRYYAFIVKSDNIVFSPAIIVNKDEPLVYCYDEDGSIKPFSSFPLYVDNNNDASEWNGTFIHYNSSGNKTAQIDISSSDGRSLMFQINAEEGFFIDSVTGLAEYDGNTAVYYVNDSPVILFVISENALSIIYTSPQNTAETSSAYMALFYREGVEIASNETAITASEEEAASLFMSLTKEQTGLIDDISSYIVIPEKLITYINGEQCYSINVYEDFAGRQEFVCSYYVSADLNRIYMYDVTLKEDVLIYDINKI